MSEAMTVERVIEAYWDLNGYWTKLRVPIKPKNSWSDIDVVAYNPCDNLLVICESKVRGKKKTVRVYSPELKNKGINFLSFDKINENTEKEKFDYLSILGHFNEQYFNDIFNILKIPKGTKIGFHLVSNYCIEDEELKREVQEDVKNYINKELNLPNHYQFQWVKIDSTLDVFCDILSIEKENKQEKRYGHPILDIAREINRYMYPDIESKKLNTIDAVYKKQNANKIKSNFLKAMGIDYDLKE